MGSFIIFISLVLLTKGVKLEEEYYYCSDGQRILAHYECDGTPQCNDKTDEDPDICDYSPDTFKCDTSKETIPANKACDGRFDCTDESDESPINCRGHRCRSSEYRCSYGGCINISSLCDGKLDCIDGTDEQEFRCKVVNLECKLPPRNNVMSYTISDCKHCQPGDHVRAHSVINFTCNHGYSFEKAKNHITATCEGARWVPEIPVCRKNEELASRSFIVRHRGKCPPIKSHGGNLECHIGNTNARVECTKPALPGTRVLVSCKQYYNLKGSNMATCQKNGKWTNEISCEPSCYKGKEMALVVHGTPIKSNQKIFPWVAGLYSLQNKHYEYQCGSTLISDDVVITAAHCIWQKQPEDLKVVIGKVYRDYYKEEPGQKAFYVKDIKILNVYQDLNGNYGSDVAILILSSKVTLTDKIHPACMQWNQNISDMITLPGKTGLVAGWGYTEYDKPSDVLRFVRIPIVDSKKCIEDEPLEFRKYVTYTSFCAGYKNGTSVCNGDSGSGLMFQSNNTWYLEGIVSISPRRTNALLCEPKLFSVFTKVGIYKPWIQRVLHSVKMSEYHKLYPSQFYSTH